MTPSRIERLVSNSNPIRNVWRSSASPRNGKIGDEVISRGPECGRENKRRSRRKEDGEEEPDTLGLRILACGTFILLIADCVWFYLNRSLACEPLQKL